MKCDICGTDVKMLLDAVFISGYPVRVKCCERCVKKDNVRLGKGKRTTEK